MEERRAHQRYPVGECGVLYALRQGASVGGREAYVFNASEGGLGLHLDEPIEVGTQVKIDLSSCVFAGTVIHCTRDGDSYVAGIKLSHGGDLVSALTKRHGWHLPTVNRSLANDAFSETN